MTLCAGPFDRHWCAFVALLSDFSAAFMGMFGAENLFLKMALGGCGMRWESGPVSVSASRCLDQLSCQRFGASVIRPFVMRRFAIWRFTHSPPALLLALMAFGAPWFFAGLSRFEAQFPVPPQFPQTRRFGSAMNVSGAVPVVDGAVDRGVMRIRGLQEGGMSGTYRAEPNMVPRRGWKVSLLRVSL